MFLKLFLDIKIFMNYSIPNMTEEITSYHFNWDDDIMLVPLSSLLYTKPIINAAKKIDKITIKIKMQPADQGVPLRRTDRMMANGIPLPPIVITQYNATPYYEILDGRHRVAMSLANHYTHIPAIIK